MTKPNQTILINSQCLESFSVNQILDNLGIDYETKIVASDSLEVDVRKLLGVKVLEKADQVVEFLDGIEKIDQPKALGRLTMILATDDAGKSENGGRPDWGRLLDNIKLDSAA